MCAISPCPDTTWLELPEGKIQLVQAVCVIGRLGDCNLVLSDEGVSRHHARIGLQATTGHAVTDLGSTNGTYVNGLKISGPTALRDGDTIGIGSLTMRFRAGASTSEAATAVSAGAPHNRQGILLSAPECLLANALRAVISGQPDFTLAGHATESRTTRQLYGRLRPSAVLLDASSDSVGALSLLADLLAADRDARVVVLMERADADYVQRVLRRGALACLLKGDPPNELVRSLESALAGSVYLSRQIAAIALRHLAGSDEAGRRGGPAGLTDRELEIFHLIASAKANREIAAILGMSVKTVETHKENIKLKLGVTSAAELSNRAREWLVS